MSLPVPEQIGDQAPQGRRWVRRFWRILPWVLLAVVVLLGVTRWGFRQHYLRAATDKMNERFEGGKGPIEVVDYWKSGEGYQVMRYRTSGSLFGEADSLTVVAPQGYSVLLQEDAQTHELTSVAVARNSEVILSASGPGEGGAPFPTAFWITPQTGPDAGNWLGDSNADGKFDFKVIGFYTPSTKYLRWEEGKGWVDNASGAVAEEAKRSLSHEALVVPLGR